MIFGVGHGASNIASLLNILTRLGVKCTAPKYRAEHEPADKLILPVVGGVDAGNHASGCSGLVEDWDKQVLDRRMLGDAGLRIQVLGAYCLNLFLSDQ